MIMWMPVKYFILPILCFVNISCITKDYSTSKENSSMQEIITHIRFLPSDELKGRKVGQPETKIAARYIAEQFRAAGLKPFASIPGYLQKAEFDIDGRLVSCNNVVGYIEGSNPELKEEFVLLCAHYDHLGVEYNIDKPHCDSIFNGARDNAMGTTALIYAAKELSKSISERSLIFLATTGEEEGMLGSEYFVANSPVSIDSIVFVLNNDGGGFNDTSNIRIGGKNKILFHPDFWNVTIKYGIECLAYPVDLEYLYERGDNITFANRGIPSIIVSPGFEKIDERILKYVHKPTDEVDDNFDFEYLLKFSMSYRDLALNIANSKTIPSWSPDSNYSFIQANVPFR